MSKPNATQILKWSTITLLIGFFAYSYFAYKDITPASTTTYTAGNLDAYIMTQKFVEEKLKSPKSADFPHISKIKVASAGDQSWKIDGYVDAINSFNASLRQKYTCLISYDATSKVWTCNSLEFL